MEQKQHSENDLTEPEAKSADDSHGSLNASKDRESPSISIRLDNEFNDDVEMDWGVPVKDPWKSYLIPPEPEPDFYMTFESTQPSLPILYK